MCIYMKLLQLQFTDFGLLAELKKQTADAGMMPKYYDALFYTKIIT